MKYIDACKSQCWHLHLWPRDEEHSEDTECVRVPYACRSWRHEGECRAWRGALDWWRISEALLKRNDWVYIILTFQHRTQREKYQTYYSAGKQWDILRKRLVYTFGSLQYVQVLERHKTGGVHINLLIGNPAIGAECRKDWRTWRKNFLKPIAVSCGFGYICWVRPVTKTPKRLANYLVGDASEICDSHKKGQLPLDAPPHFRRIRASRGLLPPLPPKELTGELVHCFLPHYDKLQPGELQPCGCKPEQHANGEKHCHATN